MSVAHGVLAGLPGGPDLPTLDLDFEAMARTQILDKRLTMTRTSHATLVDKNGLLVYAPHNYIPFSEDFTNPAWVTYGCTVTPEGTDARLTATDTNSGILLATGVRPDLTRFVRTFRVKKGTGRYVHVGGGTTAAGAFFDTGGVPKTRIVDLETGLFLTAGGDTRWTVAPAGGGYYDVSFETTAATINSQYHSSASLGMTDANGNPAPVGSYVFLRNARGLINNTIGSYVPNLTGAIVYGPRFTYDPVSKEPLGLLVEPSRTNLLPYSDEFNWSEASLTPASGLRQRVLNSAVAPDGQTRATKLIPSVESVTQRIYKAVTTTAGTVYTYSLYAKAGELTRIGIRFSTEISSNMVVDLANGNLLAAPAGTGYVSHAVTPAGNGWYRLSLTITANAGGTFIVPWVMLHPNDVLTVNFAGDGVSGFYIWGAQLEAGACASSYIPTAAAAVTRTPEGIRLPSDGWFNNGPGTFVMDFIANEYTSTRYLLSGNASSQRIVYSSGASIRTYDGANIISMLTGVVPGARYRVAVTYDDTSTATAINGMAGNTGPHVGNYKNAYRFGLGYVGDPSSSTDGVTTYKRLTYYPKRIADADLPKMTMRPSLEFDMMSGGLDSSIAFTRASTATRINAAGLIETVGINVPRFNHDPVTKARKGLLVEPAATNLLQNSTNMVAWVSNPADVAKTVDSTPAPDGSTDSVCRAERITTIGSRFLSHVFTPAASVYTFSVYLRATASGDNADFGIHQGAWIAQTGKITHGPGAVSNSGYIIVTGLSQTEWTRVEVTTNAPLVANSGTSCLVYPGGVGNALGKAILVWGGQLEVGPHATSFIPTTTTAVTRAADLPQVAGTRFGKEGTLFVEFDRTLDAASTASRYPLTINGAGRVGIYSIPGNSLSGYCYAPSVNDGVVTIATSISGVLRAALAYKPGRMIGCLNGTLGAADVTVTGPDSMTLVQIGHGNDGSAHLNGHVRKVKIFNQTLTDAQLQALTA